MQTLAWKQSYAGDCFVSCKRIGRDGHSTSKQLRAKEKILFDRNKPAPVVYLILTNQMTLDASISKIGKWNIDLGTSIPIEVIKQDNVTII